MLCFCLISTGSLLTAAEAVWETSSPSATDSVEGWPESPHLNTWERFPHNHTHTHTDTPMNPHFPRQIRALILSRHWEQVSRLKRADITLHKDWILFPPRILETHAFDKRWDLSGAYTLDLEGSRRPGNMCVVKNMLEITLMIHWTPLINILK